MIPDSEENGEKRDTLQYLFTEVGGLRVRYADRGFGDSVVLLLHGFGGDLDNWMFNLDSLAEKHRVLALDLPGHGQSVKTNRSEEHTSELQSQAHLVCRLLLEKKHFFILTSAVNNTTQ